jgi:hypothetical protein
MQDTGIKKNSYEGIIREPQPEQSNALNTFNTKFLAQTATSSQMRQQKASIVYDLGHLATSCQTHKPIDQTKWQQKPKVPLQCYISGSKFTTQKRGHSKDDQAYN